MFNNALFLSLGLNPSRIMGQIQAPFNFSNPHFFSWIVMVIFRFFSCPFCIYSSEFLTQLPQLQHIKFKWNRHTFWFLVNINFLFSIYQISKALDRSYLKIMKQVVDRSYEISSWFLEWGKIIFILILFSILSSYRHAWFIVSQCAIHRGWTRQTPPQNREKDLLFCM